MKQTSKDSRSNRGALVLATLSKYWKDAGNNLVCILFILNNLLQTEFLTAC